jgi:hypothetical protein
MLVTASGFLSWRRIPSAKPDQNIQIYDTIKPHSDEKKEKPQKTQRNAK